MKLTTQQIDAIVSTQQIARNRNQAEQKAAWRKDPAILAEAEKWAEHLNQVPAHIYSMGGKATKETIVERIVSDLASKAGFNIPMSSIEFRNQLVIASIDSADIEELKTKLNITF